MFDFTLLALRCVNVFYTKRIRAVETIYRCAARSYSQETYGRGGGVGRDLGVGVDLAGVAVDVGVAVAVAVGVAVAVAVGVDVGVGVGVGCTSNDPTSMRPLNTRTNPGPR